MMLLTGLMVLVLCHCLTDGVSYRVFDSVSSLVALNCVVRLPNRTGFCLRSQFPSRGSNIERFVFSMLDNYESEGLQCKKILKHNICKTMCSIVACKEVFHTVYLILNVLHCFCQVITTNVMASSGFSW